MRCAYIKHLVNGEIGALNGEFAFSWKTTEPILAPIGRLSIGVDEKAIP